MGDKSFSMMDQSMTAFIFMRVSRLRFLSMEEESAISAKVSLGSGFLKAMIFS